MDSLTYGHIDHKAIQPLYRNRRDLGHEGSLLQIFACASAVDSMAFELLDRSLLPIPRVQRLDKS